jgi:putative membrane-bound dehydrogenase-like protein
MKRFPFAFLFLAAFVVSNASAFAEPVPLFDGKSFHGWEGDTAKTWRIVDGAITGGSLTEKVPRNEFLATKRSYTNFELRLKVKLIGDPGTGMINSGVQIRSVRIPDDHEMSGYQVDVGEGWWGKLYDESRRNKVIADSKNPAAATAAVKKDDWNEFRIRCEGPRIQSWINGVPAIDFTETDPNVALDGHIAVQIHGGGKALVQFKDIAIEELPATPNAPTWDKVGWPKGKEKPANRPSGSVGPRSPQEQIITFKLPEGFEIELVAAEDSEMDIGKFVAVYFDQKGRLWTMTALEYPVDGNENPAAAEALYQSHARDKVLIYDRDPNSPTGFAKKPRVFKDGLAITLGILPYKDGCYVQHGPDIVFLRDADGDGRADEREVILTGFGVQDSHLMPHQFTRAPGGWIWMAQGAFNYSNVRRPGDLPDQAVPFDQARMAKFRMDGFDFQITSQGPCNIWGLVINGVGEAFIQEANDFGYPVMPFYEYANYPGCSDRQWKSYAPEFPGTAPDFRMGGTGLSGLALTDAGGPFPKPWRDVMLVANPITNRIQAIKMHRDGSRWRLEKLADFIESSDLWFRPIALTLGPDGCIYIVDWYNKVISHNEVPRNHPDRDKSRGRIWRVKPTGVQPFAVPDFTKLSGDELIAKLGGPSLAQSHLAWQAIADRGEDAVTISKLEAVILDPLATPARRIQAQWALEECSQNPDVQIAMAKDSDPNIRREAVRSASADMQWAIYEIAHQDGLRNLSDDPDPTVRAELIRKLGRYFDQETGRDQLAIRLLLSMVREPMAKPISPSTHDGKLIKVREAYDREFERFLIRMLLERQLHRTEAQGPGELSPMEKVLLALDHPSAGKPSIEAHLLASLALEPKIGVARLAKLLPQIKRPPEKEEVLRLAQFPDIPGVGGALKALLRAPATRLATLDALFAVRTQLDAAKLAPLLNDAVTALLSSSEPASLDLGLKLIGGFKLTAGEEALVTLVRKTSSSAGDDPKVCVTALRALADLGSAQVGLFADLAEKYPDPFVRDEALAALASAKTSDAAQRALALFPKLTPVQRRIALEKLSTTKAGASAIVAAASSGTLPKTDLDVATMDRLLAVLGENDPALKKLLGEMSTFFRPVLTLDGSGNAWSETGVSIDGPLTVETWVYLDPKDRPIGNADGILGLPNQLDINFYDGKCRVYCFAPLHDVAITKKTIAPGIWTHVAATRDAGGVWKIYLDGELEATATHPAPSKLENLRLAWTTAGGGLRGALAEYRIWNRERTASEIRANFDRSLDEKIDGIVFHASRDAWGILKEGTKIVQTTDLPPLLTPDQAAQLDAKFAKYTALAAQPGNVEHGKTTALICQACHLFGTTGGKIGPNLSGVGAMGIEAILRSILTPNAAMESAYRIYRVEQRDGSVLDTFFVNENPESVTVRLPGSDDRRIAKKEIVRANFLRRSLMPDGLLDGLNDEQTRDLFAYLLSLK